ncbi:probable beta-D-xylosidase 7 [Syzygium oleosum]|uniref:probable beta-D-xylosidase 7 n=1 Tax=Syzygium oleosum TaxID=219896 RepID=UPI0024B88228|nr:probable beta-D-xylosidase 7 [Syzygium oleosum]
MRNHRRVQSLSLLIAFVSVAALLSPPAASAQPPPFSCDPSSPSAKSFPFCEASLPISQRAQDLVSRLTLDEKISQLVSSAPAIPRLGIPAYEWWSESLHGVSNSGRGVRFNGTTQSATSFPQVILTAASFDVDLWYRIGQAIGTEARAVYNSGQATGMTFWAPNINIFRDPRWGRGQETPGEDPVATGNYAVAYVRGVQGDDFQGGGKLRENLQASACCKHLTAYDLDNWKGVNRFVFDARVMAQDMADTFQPPFQRCIQDGKASGIMCSYNHVNGIPNCPDYNLLSNTARRQWSFHGYITSDCDAVAIIYESQGYAKTPEDAVADVLKAGMDVNCGTYLQNHTKSAVEQTKVTVSEIDRALHNLFSVRMRLGLFNGDPKKQPFGNIGPDQVCSQKHQDLALEAARSGIVLLKNKEKRLPLRRSKSTSVAVIGPNANNAWKLLGNYAGPPCKSVTLLQALQSYVKDTRYQPGCDDVVCSSPSIAQAVEVAKAADHVVLIMGLDQTQEREDFDRVDLVLPGRQQEFITTVAQAAKKPVILVLLCGGPVDIRFARDDQNIGSILWVGYPGEAGGMALSEIIFGEHNPGGRLPVTWYPQEFTRVPMTDMRMRPEPSTGYPGRTYRFYKGQSVYEYGYGLSYTEHSYKFTSVTKELFYLNLSPKSQPDEASDASPRYRPVSDLGAEFCKKSKFEVRVEVKNHGDMASKHPVLLFVRHAKPSSGSPMKQLVAFQSVELKGGKTTEVQLALNPCDHLSRADANGVMIIEEGWRFLEVGDQEYPITVMA